MSFSVNEAGLLQGNKVKHDIVDKHSGPFEQELPDMLVMHYTAGSSLAGAVSHLKKPGISASAHLVIDRDGSIVQLVEFNKKAWHAGNSRYMNRIGINQYSIGIEMVNAGPMRKAGDEYISNFGKRYTSKDVVEAIHRNESTPRFWHIYEEEQISRTFEVCETLVPHFSIQHVVGHEEISPSRKTDPGPAFPLEQLRARLLSKRSEDGADHTVDIGLKKFDQGIVTASLLNFRDAPSPNGRLLRDPLSAGTPVSIIKERHGWYQIKLEQVGWVKKEYIQI